MGRLNCASCEMVRCRGLVDDPNSCTIGVMEWEPGARGVVVAGRYRCCGELRRRGLIDAIDIDEPSAPGCRLVGVPGDPETIDAWQAAWRAAERRAGLPTLRAVVQDADGDAWAVLAPAASAPDRSLPDDAERQARAIGAALARAGLDAADVTREMLLAVDGELLIDGVVWLGEPESACAAGDLLVGLLPAVPTPQPERSVQRRDRRPPRRRRGVQLAIGAVAVFAVAALLWPSGSDGTAGVAAAPPPAHDVLLDAVLTPQAGVAAVPATRPRHPKVRPTRPEERVGVTVTTLVSTAASEIPAVPAEVEPVEVPLADGEVVSLPLAEAEAVPLPPTGG